MVVKVDPRAENLDKLFLIYADIETESLSKVKNPTNSGSNPGWRYVCSFINPGKPLPFSGTRIHGLYFGDKKLYRDVRVLPSIRKVDALKSSINDLKLSTSQQYMCFTTEFCLTDRF